MVNRSRGTSVGAALLALAGGVFSGGAAAAFTQAQADQGRQIYEAQCGLCHGRHLEGGEAPQLSGIDVMQNFDSAGGLYEFFSVAMPPQAPGQLGDEAYLAILAHIMSVNGATPSGTALTADLDALHGISIAHLGTNIATAAQTVAAVKGTGVPQAFTWGKQLPGGAAPASIPQAFTWGKDLPKAPTPVAAPPAAAPAAPAPAPVAGSAAVARAPAAPTPPPQAFTWGRDLPAVTVASAEPARPEIPQAFTWGKTLPTAN